MVSRRLAAPFKSYSCVVRSFLFRELLARVEHDEFVLQVVERAVDDFPLFLNLQPLDADAVELHLQGLYLRFDVRLLLVEFAQPVEVRMVQVRLRLVHVGHDAVKLDLALTLSGWEFFPDFLFFHSRTVRLIVISAFCMFRMPTVRHAVLDGFAVLVGATAMMCRHGHDGKSRSMFAKEEEIRSPPPAITEPDAEDSDWKILFHYHSF